MVESQSGGKKEGKKEKEENSKAKHYKRNK